MLLFVLFAKILVHVTLRLFLKLNFRALRLLKARMTEMPAFDTILSEILKRKRKPVPEVLLTGKSIGESMNSKYSLYIAKRTPRETNQFTFNEKDVEVGMFNPRSYNT